MAPIVFKDFKDCLLGACISVNHDPTQYFNRLYATFGHMSSAKVAIPPQLQVMALAALSQKWEMLVLIVTRDILLQDLDLSDVCTAVLRQYQLETVHHNSGKHSANKISVVKRKHSDLS